jgi:hypothetical protein
MFFKISYNAVGERFKFEREIKKKIYLIYNWGRGV